MVSFGTPLSVVCNPSIYFCMSFKDIHSCMVVSFFFDWYRYTSLECTHGRNSQTRIFSTRSQGSVFNILTVLFHNIHFAIDFTFLVVRRGRKVDPTPCTSPLDEKMSDPVCGATKTAIGRSVKSWRSKIHLGKHVLNFPPPSSEGKPPVSITPVLSASTGSRWRSRRPSRLYRRVNKS